VQRKTGCLLFAARSCEFIELLRLIDAAYPTHTAIKLILDGVLAFIGALPLGTDYLLASP
jgi:hypothetical protein